MIGPGTTVRSIVFFGAATVGEAPDYAQSSVLAPQPLVEDPPEPTSERELVPRQPGRPRHNPQCDHDYPGGSLVRWGKTPSGEQRYHCKFCNRILLRHQLGDPD